MVAVQKETKDDINPSRTLDIMSQLGDVDWNHDAIMDVDTADN